MSLATYVPAPVLSNEEVEQRLKEMRIYQQAQKNIDFDRQTALRVLQDLSSCMYPSFDLFGIKTLVINRADFEKVRAKYLDRKENNQ